MNITELKTYLCEIVDEAYLTAKEEGHGEIVFPFSLVLHENDQVEYLPYDKKKVRALSSH
jgi:hypothetical protein